MKYKNPMDYKPSFRRLCKRCGKKYMPTGKYQKFCENCKLPNGRKKQNGK